MKQELLSHLLHRTHLRTVGRLLPPHAVGTRVGRSDLASNGHFRDPATRWEPRRRRLQDHAGVTDARGRRCRHPVLHLPSVRPVGVLGEVSARDRNPLEALEASVGEEEEPELDLGLPGSLEERDHACVITALAAGLGPTPPGGPARVGERDVW